LLAGSLLLSAGNGTKQTCISALPVSSRLPPAGIATLPASNASLTTGNNPLLACNEPLSTSSGTLPDSFLSQNQPFFTFPPSHGQMPANFVLPTSWSRSVVTA